ncbi:MAG TPA: hypothetical protein VHL58_13865 [Thermoanaerobaculia bacterium]|nr:hypothetical protein [Thermoanaerobaculia bacterium]
MMYAIRDLIGEPALNTALRALVAENQGQATATTADLLAQLRKVSTTRSAHSSTIGLRKSSSMTSRS